MNCPAPSAARSLVRSCPGRPGQHQDYLGQFNPQAASRLAQRLVAAGNSLAEHAERGRAVRDHRELLAVQPYLIGYRIQDNTVQIIRVRHGARESLP